MARYHHLKVKENLYNLFLFISTFITIHHSFKNFLVCWPAICLIRLWQTLSDPRIPFWISSLHSHTIWKKIQTLLTVICLTKRSNLIYFQFSLCTVTSLCNNSLLWPTCVLTLYCDLPVLWCCPITSAISQIWFDLFWLGQWWDHLD